MKRVWGWSKRHWRILPFAVVLLAMLGFYGALAFTRLPAPCYPGSCRVYDRNGVFFAALGNERFQPISLEQAPSSFIQALLAAEDERFYRHRGVDLRGAIRALLEDIRQRRFAQGASTLTMQVAKNLYLPSEKTFAYKFKQTFYALKMERTYSKNQILEMYLNRVYFGHGAYGLYAGAELFFGKKPADLTLSESALLAGILPAPERLSPYRHPGEALLRRNLTLNRMVELGFIRPSEAARARQETLRLAGLKDMHRPAPYLLDYVAQEIAGRFEHGEAWLRQGGLRIYTTIDPRAQQAAEQALQDGIRFRHWVDNGVTQPQGAIVAVDPATGAVRAMVGGLDYNETQFNRITAARRQPGSAFKPFVYAAALENGFTAATILSSEPKTYQVGPGQTYCPLDPHPMKPSLTAREALAASSNVIAVELGQRVGLGKVAGLAARLGVASSLQATLSLPLGTSEVTPLELVSAYAPFANGGYRVKPMAVLRLEASDGTTLVKQSPKREAVMNPRIAFIVTDMLRDVLRPGGTAGQLGGRPGRPAAGKTGTSENNRDAWFVGYTPDLLGLVYLGADRGNHPLPSGAGSLAAPIWAAFFELALAGGPPRDFIRPDGLVERELCAESGLLATPACPVHTEYFEAGTEPEVFCRVHRAIRVVVCRRSGLLATPNCRDTEVVLMSPEKRPNRSCNRCTVFTNFWDWLIKGAPRTDSPLSDHKNDGESQHEPDAHERPKRSTH